MKKLIAVLLLLVGCTVVQNAADSIQRNFKLHNGKSVIFVSTI